MRPKQRELHELLPTKMEKSGTILASVSTQMFYFGGGGHAMSL